MQGVSDEKKIYTVWSRSHWKFNYGEQVVIIERQSHGRVFVRAAHNPRASGYYAMAVDLWSDEMGYHQGTEYK